jgi:hypothetical protein
MSLILANLNTSSDDTARFSLAKALFADKTRIFLDEGTTGLAYETLVSPADLCPVWTVWIGTQILRTRLWLCDGCGCSHKRRR